MSKATNIVAISGNLTRDPELRVTSGGSSVCQLSVAVNGREKDRQTGEWCDRPDYFDCTVFGATAENAASWLHKGSHVEISGRLRQDRWETDSGQNRSAVKIIAGEIVFPPKSQSGGDADNQQPAQTQQTAQPAPVGAAASDAGDDDIPF